MLLYSSERQARASKAQIHLGSRHILSLFVSKLFVSMQVRN